MWPSFFNNWNLVFLWLIWKIEICFTNTIHEDYAFDNIDGLTFRETSTSIQISDIRYYDQDRQFLIFDDGNNATISGIVPDDNITNYRYDFVFSMWVYIYRTDNAETFFWAAAQSEGNTSSHKIFWVTYEPGNSIYMSYTEDGTSFGKYFTDFYPSLGWQLISYVYRGGDALLNSSDEFSFFYYNQSNYVTQLKNGLEIPDYRNYASSRSTIGYLIRSDSTKANIL